MSRPRLLLTGFGPFPGAPSNPTGAVVARVEAMAPRLDVEVIGHVFATRWEALDELAAVVAAARPDAILHLGLARRAREIRVERLARRFAAPWAVDAAGAYPPAGLLGDGGPFRRPVRLPVERLAARISAAGVPAVVSEDAGAYLCNALLRRSLAIGDEPTGLVHLPRVGAHLVDGSRATLPGLARAVAVAVGVMFARKA